MYRVLKYGGTSVGSTEKIKKIAQYLKSQTTDKKDKLVVVVSAMNKHTDELIHLAEEVTSHLSGREMDRLLSIGEQQTIALLALACNHIDVPTISLTSVQLKIKSTNEFNNAKIQSISKEILLKHFESHDVIVVAGFQGINDDDEITTLGRGGSDTSAVAIASVLGCLCEIYTDVSGIYTTDPRIVPQAKKLEQITFDEMSELATLGASVMHNRSIIVGKKFNTPIYVAKALSEEKGTYIMSDIIESNAVTAVTSEKEIVNYTITTSDNGLLSQITDSKINIDMVSQLISDGKLVTAFSTNRSNLERLEKITAGHNIKVRSDLCKISLVGMGMRDSSGVMSKIFQCLKDNDIHPVQISTSEITVSLLIATEDCERATQKLCEIFELIDQSMN